MVIIIQEVNANSMKDYMRLICDTSAGEITEKHHTEGMYSCRVSLTNQDTVKLCKYQLKTTQNIIKIHIATVKVKLKIQPASSI